MNRTDDDGQKHEEPKKRKNLEGLSLSLSSDESPFNHRQDGVKSLKQRIRFQQDFDGRETRRGARGETHVHEHEEQGKLQEEDATQETGQ